MDEGVSAVEMANDYSVPLGRVRAHRRRNFISRMSSRLLARSALHIAVVVVPVGLVLVATSELSPVTLVGAGIAVAVWLGALSRSYWSACVPPPVHGIGVVSATVEGLAVLSVLDFWLPRIQLDSGHLLLMTAGLLITCPSFEALAKRFESRPRVLVVGTSDGCVELLSDFAQRSDLPFECEGIVEGGRGVCARHGLHRGTLPELAQVVTRAQPDLVVLGDDAGRAQAVSQLLEIPSANFRVVGLYQFYEHAFGKVPVKHLSPAWFMSVLHLYHRPTSRITKRIFDLALAAVGLATVAPLLLMLAFLVKLSSPGPIIFRQVRLGEGGKRFEVLKFRSMFVGAERDGEPVWAIEHDPRVTRIGNFMRSTRLDELPQLWNVIRGEMSVVGPRPERPEFLDLLRDEVPFWTSRHLVKPGITGWAQVCLGYTSDALSAAEKLSYDLYYLRHRSVRIDLAIIAKTARTVLLGLAAHYRDRSQLRLDQAPSIDQASL
jgi:exopolysaccharide biosynthesis polyprenyl glycosylphosphotransferase